MTTIVGKIDPEQYPLGMPVCLAMIAGFVDACTFLAFAGFFVAQATGSFVVAGSDLLDPNRAYLIKVVAIPVFVLSGIAATLVCRALTIRHALSATLWIELVLLVGLLVASFTSVPGAISTEAALLGLAAMGVQSAAVRILLPTYGSTNVMTSNTTQLSIEIVDSVLARRVTTRLKETASIMLAFLLGVLAGGFAFRGAGLIAMLIPAILLLCLALSSSFKHHDVAA